MRHVITAVVVVAVEGYLYWRYRALGAQFHFWLHGLFGAAIGVAGTTGWALLRRRRPGAVWGPGLVGHVYSAFPDALFLSAGILHALWMDVFAFHIAVHLVPAPLITMLGVFALALLAWLAASLDGSRMAVAALVLAVGVTTVALLVAPAIPTTVEQIRDAPEIALLCPLREVDVASW